MPIVSQAQRGAMYEAAEGHSTLGIPKSVGKEFVASDRPGKLPEHVAKHAFGGDAVGAATHIARSKLQFGGFSAMNPWWERAEARQADSPSYGFSMGTGGGRTDKNNVSVAAGSYVLPADVVSGLGEGNSLAGAAAIDKMIRTLPYGISPMSGGRHGPGPPHAPAPYHEPPAEHLGLAKGGRGQQEDEDHVPIAAADGEVILRPEHVMAIGRAYYPSDKPANDKDVLSHGHEVLDSFVKEVRGRTIKDMKKLPGPENSKNSDEGHFEGKEAA